MAREANASPLINVSTSIFGMYGDFEVRVRLSAAPSVIIGCDPIEGNVTPTVCLLPFAAVANDMGCGSHLWLCV